jgi:hypothetical protein
MRRDRPTSVRFPKKGLAFRLKRSMCVVIARASLPRAVMSRPDVLIRSGLVSVRAWISQAFIETKGQHMSAKLTENQHALLKSASRRDDRCFVLPSNLKGGAAQKVAAKLIAEGLAKEIKAKAGAPIWRRDTGSDQAYSLKLSAAGAKAGATNDEQSEEPASGVSLKETPPKSMDSSETSSHTVEAGKAAPREGSKLASVMALLRRSEGVTVMALTEATGWLPHTTRAGAVKAIAACRHWTRKITIQKCAHAMNARHSSSAAARRRL